MTGLNERTLGDNELLIERVFDAPAILVFKMWAERDHMMRWIGPKDFVCTELEMDFRPGGLFRACIVHDDHGESWFGGVYKEIVPYSRLVYSFAWEDGPDQPGVETLVTLSFHERDGRTLQRFHQTPFQNVDMRDSHIGGWDECFDREGVYLKSLAGGIV